MVKKVITYGTFDLFHIGHVRLLERLSKLGDELIVCVSTDEFNSIKGKSSVIPYEQRAELVMSCKYVDRVLPEHDWDQKRTDIIREKIDIFAMGDDWAGKFDDLSDVCEVIYLPRTEDISSTSLKKIIAKMSSDEESTKSPSWGVVFKDIVDIATNGHLDKRTYKKFLNILLDNEDDKDLNWLRSWVLLNSITHKKAFKTQSYISKMVKISRRRGKMDEYNSFMSLLFDEMGLMRPIGGKYSQSFGDKNVDEILTKCYKINDDLKSAGVQAFASSGTLLGLIREGKLLSHDNDIDLVVVLSSRTEEEAAREWLSLCDKLIGGGIAMSRSEWSGVTLKLQKINGFGVDLFPAWVGADDEVYIFPYCYGNLNRDQIFPLHKNTASGLMIPNDSEAVLKENYGVDWNHPDEGWSFNWPAARKKFSKLLEKLNYQI